MIRKILKILLIVNGILLTSDHFMLQKTNCYASDLPDLSQDYSSQSPRHLSTQTDEGFISKLWNGTKGAVISAGQTLVSPFVNSNQSTGATAPSFFTSPLRNQEIIDAQQEKIIKLQREIKETKKDLSEKKRFLEERRWNSRIESLTEQLVSIVFYGVAIGKGGIRLISQNVDGTDPAMIINHTYGLILGGLISQAVGSRSIINEIQLRIQGRISKELCKWDIPDVTALILNMTSGVCCVLALEKGNETGLALLESSLAMTCLSTILGLIPSVPDFKRY